MSDTLRDVLFSIRHERLAKKFRGRKLVDVSVGYDGEIVYFVQAEKGGPIKIGRTSGSRLQKRITQLQCGNPERLIVRRLVQCDDRELEAFLHGELREHRMTGEWFRPSKRVRELARPANPRALVSGPGSVDRMLTVAEAAELLSVSQDTIRRWIAGGELPAFQRGRIVRLSRAHVMEHAGILGSVGA